MNDDALRRAIEYFFFYAGGPAFDDDFTPGR
jgi:hypothetical protein